MYSKYIDTNQYYILPILYEYTTYTILYSTFYEYIYTHSHRYTLYTILDNFTLYNIIQYVNTSF